MLISSAIPLLMLYPRTECRLSFYLFNLYSFLKFLFNSQVSSSSWNIYGMLTAYNNYSDIIFEMWTGVKLHLYWKSLAPSTERKLSEWENELILKNGNIFKGISMFHLSILFWKISIRYKIPSPSYKDFSHGEPGWLSLLSFWLWLRSWSCSSWVRAPCWALCWRLRAWSLLRILRLLSPPLPRLCSLSLSLSLKIN